MKHSDMNLKLKRFVAEIKELELDISRCVSSETYNCVQFYVLVAIAELRAKIRNEIKDN